MSVDVLAVSSRGQIVLPVDMRRAMGIESGDRLAAWSNGDVIMLKRVELPESTDFERWHEEAQAWAAQEGFSEDDIASVISDVRARRRVQ